MTWMKISVKNVVGLFDMKSVIIIALAFVLLTPIIVYGEEYQLYDKWDPKDSNQFQFNQLSAIAIDSKDQVYIADTQRNQPTRIQIFQNNGDFIKEWKFTELNIQSPIREIQINSKDQVYVATRDGNDIKFFKLSLDGEIRETWGTEKSNDVVIDMLVIPNNSSPSSHYDDFFIDHSDNLYFFANFFSGGKDDGLGTLGKYSSEGKLLKTFQDVYFPLTQDDEGNFYSYGNCKIVKYDQSFKKLLEFGECKYRGGPGTFGDGHYLDMNVGLDGLLYTTRGNYNSIFTLDGELLGWFGHKSTPMEKPSNEEYRWAGESAIDSENKIFFLEVDKEYSSVFVFQKGLNDVKPIIIPSTPQTTQIDPPSLEIEAGPSAEVEKLQEELELQNKQILDLKLENRDLKKQIENLNAIIMEQIKVIYEWILEK